MYKLKYNNTINESFEKELDARLSALATFKKDTNIKLIEVLNENDETIFKKERNLEEPVGELILNGEEVGGPVTTEEPATEEEMLNGTNSLIRGLISRAWETIDDYNSTIITISTLGTDSDEVINKLQSILDDLNVHVGILESCIEE